MNMSDEEDELSHLTSEEKKPRRIHASKSTIMTQENLEQFNHEEEQEDDQ